MDSAPDEESPGGSVPQAAEEHGEDEVCVGAGRASSISAEGDVEVVSEPRGKGDVPAAPEVGDGGGSVGGIEVFCEDEPEHQSESDGHVGIAAEVEVDLHGVAERAEPSVDRGAGGGLEGGVSDLAAGVGEEDLF